MNNKETLEVGDVVFVQGSWGGTLRRDKVERVTNVYAFIGGAKVKRKLETSSWSNGKLVIERIGNLRWGNVSYHLPTPELEAEFRKQEIVAQLNQQKWNNYKNEDLEKIWKVVAEKLAGDVIAASYKK